MRVLAWDVGIKNLSYCLVSCESKENFVIDSWGLIDVTNGVSSKNIGPEELRIMILTKLDALLDVLIPDDGAETVILIENQPVLKNPVMKSVSCFLFDFFLLKGKVDMKRVSRVVFTSPVNKLKLGILCKEEIQEIACKSSYLRNKKIAVLTCTKLLAGKKESESIFYSSKKKDDLADSFLLAFHYCSKNYVAEK